MAIVINGSGTVTGLAVGGLPDGTVDSGTIATGTIVDADVANVAASKLTGALPAISGASLTSLPVQGIDGDADSWHRVTLPRDQDSAAVIDFNTSIYLGSNITESGGRVTVSTAGWYWVSFHLTNQSAFADNMIMYLRKNTTRVQGTIYWEGNTEINYLGVTSSTLIKCSANDILDIYGTGYYSGDNNVNTLSWFTGIRLGA